MDAMDVDEQQSRPAAGRSGRGRPPKLTPAMIVAATRHLLATRLPDEVTFARVARMLGVPVSSVYNYFPNRDVLLAAVAVDVFAGFHFDDPGDALPWQDRLRAWLDEIDRFFERNPVAFRVMATSSQASPAWVAVRAPLLRVLRSLGFAGRELSLIHAWFEGQVTGLLLVENHAGRNRPLAACPNSANAGATDAAMRDDMERRSHLPTIKREEILEIGFDAMIAALENLVRQRRVRDAG